LNKKSDIDFLDNNLTNEKEEIVIKTKNGMILSIGTCSDEFKTFYSMKSMTQFHNLKNIITLKI